MQEQDTTGTTSPLSSATVSTAYHSVARVPSPNRAISRLSLYTAYRHPSGNTPAPESSSGIASPGSAHSLLFTLAQSMRRRSVDDTKSASPEGSPELSSASSLTGESIGGPSTPPVSGPDPADVPDPRDQHEGVMDVDRTVTTNMSSESDIQTEGVTDAYSEPASMTQIPGETVPISSGTCSSDLMIVVILKACGDSSDSGTTSTVSGTRSQSSQGSSDSRSSASPESVKPAAPPSRFLCRVCSEHPVEPTVTMCGHLFCRR